VRQAKNEVEEESVSTLEAQGIDLFRPPSASVMFSPQDRSESSVSILLPQSILQYWKRKKYQVGGGINK